MYIIERIINSKLRKRFSTFRESVYGISSKYYLKNSFATQNNNPLIEKTASKIIVPKNLARTRKSDSNLKTDKNYTQIQQNMSLYCSEEENIKISNQTSTNQINEEDEEEEAETTQNIINILNTRKNTEILRSKEELIRSVDKLLESHPSLQKSNINITQRMEKYERESREQVQYDSE